MSRWLAVSSVTRGDFDAGDGSSSSAGCGPRRRMALAVRVVAPGHGPPRGPQRAAHRQSESSTTSSNGAQAEQEQQEEPSTGERRASHHKHSYNAAARRGAVAMEGRRAVTGSADRSVRAGGASREADSGCDVHVVERGERGGARSEEGGKEKTEKRCACGRRSSMEGSTRASTMRFGQE